MTWPTPQSPRSVPGFVLATILARRAAGTPPAAFLSCDNVPGNGATLRRCVLALAQTISRPRRLDRGSRRLSRHDGRPHRARHRPEDIVALSTRPPASPTVPSSIGEPFRMWVITRDPRMTCPDWEAAGALIVADVGPLRNPQDAGRERNADRTLPPRAILRGIAFMSDVMADPVFAAFAARTIRAEVAPDPAPGHGIDTAGLHRPHPAPAAEHRPAPRHRADLHRRLAQDPPAPAGTAGGGR